MAQQGYRSGRAPRGLRSARPTLRRFKSLRCQVAIHATSPADAHQARQLQESGRRWMDIRRTISSVRSRAISTHRPAVGRDTACRDNDPKVPANNREGSRSNARHRGMARSTRLGKGRSQMSDKRRSALCIREVRIRRRSGSSSMTPRHRLDWHGLGRRSGDGKRHGDQDKSKFLQHVVSFRSRIAWRDPGQRGR
jgi:hypothetical protein